jgi:hypothetical protein
MDYNRLEKYIEYVRAQAGEGYNTKSDIIEDLRHRGLTDEEITYVIDNVWSQGEKSETKLTKYGIFLFSVSIILVLIVISFLDIRHLPPRPILYLLTFFIVSLIILFRKRHFKNN